MGITAVFYSLILILYFQPQNVERFSFFLPSRIFAPFPEEFQPVATACASTAAFSGAARGEGGGVRCE